MALTLEQALAELRRIGPVYDAAVRASRGDVRAYGAPVHRMTLEERLHASIKAANPGPEFPPSIKSETVATGAWWTGTDWDTYAADP